MQKEDKYQFATTPTGKAMQGTKNLAKYCIDNYNVGTMGIYCNRNIRGKNQLSIHAEGRAWDAKCTPDNPDGDRLANDLWNNRKVLGIQRIIWNKKVIDVREPEWKDYDGVNPHIDHLHIEQRRDKANTLSYREIML